MHRISNASLLALSSYGEIMFHGDMINILDIMQKPYVCQYRYRYNI